MWACNVLHVFLCGGVMLWPDLRVPSRRISSAREWPCNVLHDFKPLLHVSTRGHHAEYEVCTCGLGTFNIFLSVVGKMMGMGSGCHGHMSQCHQVDVNCP